MSQLSAVVPKLAPAAASPVTITTGTSWASGSYSQLLASTSADAVLLGVFVTGVAVGSKEYEIDIAIGAASSEDVIATFRIHVEATNATPRGYHPLLIPRSGITNGSRISARARTSHSSTVTLGVKAWYAEGWDGNSESYTYRCIPSAAAGVSITPSGTGWANSSFVELASALSNAGIAGLAVTRGVDVTGYELDIATGGAGSETVITTLRGVRDGAGYPLVHLLSAIYKLSSAQRVSVRLRKNGTSTSTWAADLLYYGDVLTGIQRVTQIVKLIGTDDGGALR
jgi:hypothetical protein